MGWERRQSCPRQRAVKFVATLMKATYRPLGLITGSNESPLAGWPSGVTLTSDVCPVVVSRTNTEVPWLLVPSAEATGLLPSGNQPGYSRR